MNGMLPLHSILPLFCLAFCFLLSLSDLKDVVLFHNCSKRFIPSGFGELCELYVLAYTLLSLCLHPFLLHFLLLSTLQMHLLTAHIDDLTAEVAAPLDRLVSVALQASRTSGMAKEKLMEQFLSKETFINDQLDEVRWVEPHLKPNNNRRCEVVLLTQ